MRSELASRLLLATYVLLALGGIGFVGIARERPEEGLLLLLLGGFAIAGRLVTRRRPDNRIGWILAWIAVVFALTGVTEGVAASATEEDSRLAVELASWITEWVWYFWLGLVGVALPLLFPDGAPPSSRWRPVAWLGVTGTLIGAVGSAIAPGPMPADAEITLVNPVGIPGADAISDALTVSGTTLMVAAALGAAAALVTRLRRSRGVERQQLKWFAFVISGMVVALVVSGLTVAVGALIGTDHGVVFVVGSVGWMSMLFLMGIGIPAATGVAVLRHRLYDIDLVIRRTVAYAGLTASLVLAYLGAVLLLQLALSPLTEASDLAIAGSTLAVAALFRPLRTRIQEAVDRRFYRRRYDAAHTVEEFGTRLRDQVELLAVAAELRAVAAQTMQPAHVTLWLREREAPR